MVLDTHRLALGPRDDQVPTPRRGRNQRLLHRDDVAGYLFLSPWLLGFFGITIMPMLYSLVLSFTEYSVITGEVTWVGLANYERLLGNDPRFWQAVKVTVIYVGVSVPLKLALALAAAVILNRERRGVVLMRALVFLPSVLGVSVALAIAWRAMFAADGGVSRLLSFAGLPGNEWIAQTSTPLLALILLAIWQFGGPMVIYLAGLKQIPAVLAEAARVDGAGRWRTFRSVTVPMLSPVLLLTIAMEIIAGFQGFAAAYVFGNGGGGEGDAVLTYTLYLYLRGFAGLEMGYACAMAWVFLVAVGLLTGFIFWSRRFWVHHQGSR